MLISNIYFCYTQNFNIAFTTTPRNLYWFCFDSLHLHYYILVRKKMAYIQEQTVQYCIKPVVIVLAACCNFKSQTVSLFRTIWNWKIFLWDNYVHTTGQLLVSWWQWLMSMVLCRAQAAKLSAEATGSAAASGGRNWGNRKAFAGGDTFNPCSDVPLLSSAITFKKFEKQTE